MAVRCDPTTGLQWQGVLPGKPQPYVLRKGEGERARHAVSLATGAESPLTFGAASV